MITISKSTNLNTRIFVIAVINIFPLLEKIGQGNVLFVVRMSVKELQKCEFALCKFVA